MKLWRIKHDGEFNSLNMNSKSTETGSRQAPCAPDPPELTTGFTEARRTLNTPPRPSESRSGPSGSSPTLQNEYNETIIVTEA